MGSFNCHNVIKGRKEEPSVGIIDAQLVKNTLVSSQDKGFDAGKKIKSIKRHIIVDTLGLILAVVIQSASVQDRDGAVDVVNKLIESWKKVIKNICRWRIQGAIDKDYKNKIQNRT